MKIYELPTPCYVIDEKKLRENLEVLKGVKERTGCKILLAQKAFSCFHEYPLIGRYLDGTTASSGNTIVLLSMLLIGTRVCGIRPGDLKDKDYHIAAALRLIVLPLLALLLLRPLHLDDCVWRTIYLLTAMPCGTLTAMQAELYGGDSRFAARAIAYSTLLSLATVPVMSLLL